MPGTRRVNIGFQGGQVLAVRLEDAQWRALQEALGAAKDQAAIEPRPFEQALPPRTHRQALPQPFSLA